MARWPAASAQVIVLDGPLSPWMIVTWQASMLGRYFSSHSGVSWFMPSMPHFFRSRSLPLRATCEGGGQLVQVGADQPRADVAAEAIGVERGRVGVGLGLDARSS